MTNVLDLRPYVLIIDGRFSCVCPPLPCDGNPAGRIQVDPGGVSSKQALANNRQLAAAGFAAEKANWDRRNAWSQFAPRVSFNTEVTRIDEQTLAERDFSRYFPPEIPVPQVAFRTLVLFVVPGGTSPSSTRS